MRQGRGAPWELHLWIGAILHLPIAQRDSNWHVLRLPTAEVIRIPKTAAHGARIPHDRPQLVGPATTSGRRRTAARIPEVAPQWSISPAILDSR